MEDKFDIWVAGREGKEFRLNVVVTYESAQVIRFRLYTEKNEFTLEKRLLTKTQPWKLTSTTFEFNDRDAGETLHRIFDRLDLEIKGEPRAYIHPKNAR